jgi:putative ABC transport system substrate-binding protein
MRETIGRRAFLTSLAAAGFVQPFAARAQQSTLPVVGVVSGQSPNSDARNAAAFYKGLSEAGYVDGQNVTVEYHWVEGHYDRLPALMAELVRRQVAVIATTGNNATALAAKAATTTIPVVFAVGQDPVKLGLVASLARPRGNATGVNDFLSEVDAKRLRLLHDMVPKAARVAVLVNPANTASAEAVLQGPLLLDYNRTFSTPRRSAKSTPHLQASLKIVPTRCSWRPMHSFLPARYNLSR